MAVTPNYSWPVPVATDYVKDGWEAISDLGDAIDASLNTALGGKITGMVLLNTTNFSAVSNQSINNVFSSTYDNYLIIWNISNETGTSTCTLRFRTSGVDYSVNDYYGSGYGVGLGPTTTSYNDGPGTSFKLGNTDFQGQGGGQILVNRTSARINYQNYVGNNAYAVNYSGSSAGAGPNFTGFTILSAGTITGSLSVYGYNK